VQVYIFILWWETKEKEKITNCTFFCLDAKERYQRKIAESPYVRHPQACGCSHLNGLFKAALPGLLRKYFQLKGRNSLRSNSLPFLTPKTLSTLNTPTVRPGNHAA